MRGVEHGRGLEFVTVLLVEVDDLFLLGLGGFFADFADEALDPDLGFDVFPGGFLVDAGAGGSGFAVFEVAGGREEGC